MPLHNIKLRGTIRKFCIENEINCLVENATDKENTVRLAFLGGEDIGNIKIFLNTIIIDFNFVLIVDGIQNPVLSKIKVNDIDRY